MGARGCRNGSTPLREKFHDDAEGVVRRFHGQPAGESDLSPVLSHSVHL